MPWCEDCSKYLAPTAMTEQGRCPACGSEVELQARQAAEVADQERAPWHFKLLVVALVAYLGWRVVELFI
jgi:DNA-directed RNA polymerase subunit RPC12/RpoP